MIAPRWLMACFYVSPSSPTPVLPFSVKKILNSQLVSTLLPLFSLSYTAGLCIFVGDVNSPVWHTMVLSPLLTFPHGLRAHCCHERMGLTPHLTWGQMCGEGGDLREVGHQIPVLEFPCIRGAGHRLPYTLGAAHPTAGPELGGVSKLLPHSFDIYFMLTSATWYFIHSCVF